MSEAIFFRGLFASIMALSLAWAIFTRNDNELNNNPQGEKVPRYLPYISGGILPFFLLLLTIVSYFVYGPSRTAKEMITLCLAIFPSISIYFLVLMLCLPWLRKYINARACGMLWMLPNYLYLMRQSFMSFFTPAYIFPVSQKAARLLFTIWFLGIAAVLLWKLAEHMFFRRKILQGASQIHEHRIVAIWDSVIRDANVKKPRFKLMRSPALSTPLSIGLFKRTTRVILPKKSYTDEELELIFRHEIIHISREDSWNKFFLVFCTAICWFNPLMWVVMGRCTEDLELSCDETVLLDADDTARVQYANLLLNTAGDSRGFTTCLSGSAASMRYRLKSIMNPGKRSSGAVIAGILIFILVMSCGFLGIAFETGTGEEMIYKFEDPGTYDIRNISMRDDDFNRVFEVTDPEGFHAYFSGLQFYELTKNFPEQYDDRGMFFLIEDSRGTLGLDVSDHILRLSYLYRVGPNQSEYFYLPEGIDWDHLDTLIAEYPSVIMDMTYASGEMQHSHCHLQRLYEIKDGKRELVHKEIYPDGGGSGMYTSHGFPESAALSFSLDPITPCSVKIENWSRTDSYTITQNEASDIFSFPLSDEPAHYTIYVSFQNRHGGVYDAEFTYDLGRIGDD